MHTINAVKSEHHVYACIQRALFTKPRIAKHPQYASVIANVHKLQYKVLELGCCFGTDARKLISDGLLPGQLWVSDLHDAYWNIGRSTLFKDEPPVHKLFVDFSCASDSIPSSHFSAVSCQMVLHVLSRGQCEGLLANIVLSLKPGGLLFGSCIGTIQQAHDWLATPTKGLPGRKEERRHRHSKASLAELLARLGYTQIEVVDEPLSGTAIEPDTSSNPVAGIPEDGVRHSCMLCFSAAKGSH